MDEIKIKVYGDPDEGAIEQMQTCAEDESTVAAALMADHHVGYSMPIGGVIAYEDKISPSGVGYDIACGNKAVKTDLNLRTSTHDEVREYVSDWMNKIYSQISFGIGRKNKDVVQHEVLDKIRDANFEPQRDLWGLACEQIGTVGSGNHYVDLFIDDEGNIWIGVHFGSRGFGHKTATGFMAMAQGKEFGEKAQEGEMFSPPILFDVNDEIGQAYIEAMNLAGDYAYAGRDVVCQKVLDILGANSVYEVHNHHNFAWQETHDGKDCWVVRKGATPAWPGQEGFVGASMEGDAVILEGTTLNNDSLNSTVHGAGRIMSRRKAAGKFKYERRYMCGTRDCPNIFDIDGVSGHLGPPRKGVCPDHPNSKVIKTKIRVQKSKGLVDFDSVKERIEAKGIELRGAGADEAPEVYKNLDEVLTAHEGEIKILSTLRPIGVAMAGEGVYDPYKD